MKNKWEVKLNESLRNKVFELKIENVVNNLENAKQWMKIILFRNLFSINFNFLEKKREIFTKNLAHSI